MVIVVPPLAEREQGKERVIARGIRGFVSPRPPDVRDRVDEERDVGEDNGADCESLYDIRRSRDRETQSRVRRDRHVAMSIQPAQLRERGEVFDTGEIA